MLYGYKSTILLSTQLPLRGCGLQCLAAFVIKIGTSGTVGLLCFRGKPRRSSRGHDHFSLLGLNSILRLGVDVRKVLLSQFAELHHSVQVGVVSEMTLEHNLFPDTEVARVNSDTTVFAGSALSDVGPVSLLFTQVETSRIGEEDPAEDET